MSDFVLAVLASEGTISGSSLVVPLMALREDYIQLSAELKQAM